MFQVHLKRMYILGSLDVMSWKYQWSLTCIFRISVALIIFSLEYLSIDKNVVLKRPIIVVPSISPFMPASICFMCLSAPTILGAYTLTNVKSSSCTDPSLLYSALLYGLSFKAYFIRYVLWPPLSYHLHEISFSIPSLSVLVCPLP